MAHATGFTQDDSQKMVYSVVDAMNERFQEGENVLLPGFGTFEVKKRMERIIVNPNTRQRLLVPPKLVLGFRPTASIRRVLKEGATDTAENTRTRKGELAGIVNFLVEKHSLPAVEAEHFVNEIISILNEGLRQDRLVKVKGLGTFKVIDVKERASVDVNTGERIVIEGRSKISFTPDSVMKDLVNKPFSQFETVVLNEGVTFDDIEESDTDDDTETIAEEEPLIPDEPEPAEEEKEPVVFEEPEPAEEEEEPVVIEEPEPAEEEEEPVVIEELEPVEEEEPVVIEEPETAEEEEEPIVIEEPEPAEEEEEPVVIEEPEPVEEEEEPVVFEEPEPVQMGPLPLTEEPVAEETIHEEALVEEKIPEKTETINMLASTETEENITETEENITETEDKPDVNEEQNACRRTPCYPYVLTALIALAVGFGAGWFVRGLQPGFEKPESQPIIPVVTDTIAPTDSIDAAQKAAEQALRDSLEQVRKDSIEAARRDSLEKVRRDSLEKVQKELERVKKELEAQQEAEAKAKEEAQKKAKQQAAQAAASNNSSLDAAHRQVELGAYKIVGTQETITVKEGQTLARISKFYFGEGMECYLQVHNGVSEVKPGMKLKIPKLQIKKKH